MDHDICKVDILSFLKDDCYEIETSKSSIRFMRLSGNQQMMNTSNIDKRIKLRYLKWLFVVEKYDLMITFKKKKYLKGQEFSRI